MIPQSLNYSADWPNPHQRLSAQATFTPENTAPQQGLWLPFPKNRRWVALAQLVRLEGVGNYTQCHFLDGSQLLVARSLKVLTSRLPAGSFLRSHRKHLLNTQYIISISLLSATVRMTNGEQFPLARRRTAECRQIWHEAN